MLNWCYLLKKEIWKIKEILVQFHHNNGNNKNYFMEVKLLKAKELPSNGETIKFLSSNKLLKSAL